MVFQITLHIITLMASLVMAIAVFSNKQRTRKAKLLLLLLANGVFTAALLLYPLHRPNDLILMSLIMGTIDICAFNKIFSKDDPAKEKMYAEWSANPANYKFWIFYYNSKDERLLPPKRMGGLGWTVNFANPFSVLLMVVLITLIFVLTKMFM